MNMMFQASQSATATSPVEQLTEAESSSSILQVALTIMTEKAVFLREEDKMKTKPCLFDNPQILARLAMAFCIGATVEEAAIFAGCSPSTIKKHIRERTPFQYKDPHGEDYIRTLMKW